jgi:DedD protein
MADKDAQIELRKRARRRLVGAVALALLAAIVLPMVMEQEPKQVNQDIQVRIPGRDSPFPQRAAPSQAAVPAEGKPASEASGAPQPAEKVPAPLEPPAAGATGTAAPPAGKVQDKPPIEAKSAKAPEKAVEKVAEKPVAEKTAAKPTDTVAAKRPEAKTEEARAEAILNAADQFVVQLGVFAEPDNVRKVQARVKAEGYNSFVESVRTASGLKTRVRAGPFESRDAAEKARERLRKSGLDGMVAPKS